MPERYLAIRLFLFGNLRPVRKGVSAVKSLRMQRRARKCKYGRTKAGTCRKKRK